MAKRVVCVVVLVLLGHALNGAAGDPGTVRWATKTGGNVPSGIAIGADGTAYATSSYYGYIGAVDPSGTRIWLLQLNSSYWESVSAPSIAADGTLYVRTDEIDGLWAINPDGTVKWNIPFTSGHSPSIGADGTLYLSCFGHQRRFVQMTKRNSANAPVLVAAWVVSLRWTPSP